MSEWVDVTRPLRAGMIHWPTDRGFQLRAVERLGGPGTCNLSEIHTSAHVGTHVDAPRHFFDEGVDVADLPLDKLCGPATVVDYTAEGHVAAAALAQAEIPRGDRILLRTTNTGLWEQPVFQKHFIALTEEAARWLVEHETPLVGIDYVSIEPYHCPDHRVHRMLLAAGMVVLEGLDLTAISAGRYELVALPLKIEGGDGAPARVIVRPIRH